MPPSKHDTLDTKPIDLKEHSCKQSKHSHVPKVPLRMILLAPSGSGKTVLLSNLILNIYRGCFERIFVFSPSIDIDKTWEPVKKHQEDDMKAVEKGKDKLYFNHYDPADLEHIIDTQHKVIKLMKSSNQKKLFSILIVIDDFADDAVFTGRASCYTHFTQGGDTTVFQQLFLPRSLQQSTQSLGLMQQALSFTG